MSDAMSNAKIEDVLSSIRRLVTEETKKSDPVALHQEVRPAAPKAADKLVLAPAQRVESAQDDMRQAPTPPTPVEPEAPAQAPSDHKDFTVVGGSDLNQPDDLATIYSYGVDEKYAENLLNEDDEDIAFLSAANLRDDDVNMFSEPQTDKAEDDEPPLGVLKLVESDRAPAEDDQPERPRPALKPVVLSAAERVDLILPTEDVDVAPESMQTDDTSVEVENQSDMAADQDAPIPDAVPEPEPAVTEATTAEPEIATVDDSATSVEDAADNQTPNTEEVTVSDAQEVEEIQWQDVDSETNTVETAVVAEAVVEETIEAVQEAAVDSQDLDDAVIDEDMLRDMVAEIVRDELRGPLGEKITRNVRKLVRREIHRALSSQDLE